MTAVEELFVEPAVEGLNSGVLPVGPRSMRIDSAPVHDGVSEELGAVVEADEAGCHAALGDDGVQDIGDVVGTGGAMDWSAPGFVVALIRVFGSQREFGVSRVRSGCPA